MSPLPAAPEPLPPDLGAAGLRAAAGLFVGFALLALVNAGAIALRIPLPAAGVGLRAWHHAFDLAETLGLGLLVGALAGGYSAMIRLPAYGAALVYGSATVPVVALAMGEQLYREACVPGNGRWITPLFVLFVCGAGLGVPAAHLLGAYLSRFPRLRLVPVVVAVGVMIGDHLVMPDDFIASHGVVAWIAATLAGASLAPLAERALLALRARRGGRAALAVVGSVAGAGIAAPPFNDVRLQLFRQPCAVAPWALASALWRAPRPRRQVPAPTSRWFRARAGEPPTPSARRRPLPENPVVVLITIDATRADAVNDPKNDALFPTLADMKRRGAWFTAASSPASQTAVSLSTAFSGRYFSELRWEMFGVGASRFAYASDDPAPRFPALLSAAGVGTATWVSISFLSAPYGVVRGFKEEQMSTVGRRHASAKPIIDPLLERLRKAGPEPLFLYAHLTEPHEPYDRGRQDGTPWQRYISEIAVADAQLGRIVRMLDTRFPGRGILIVSADHGEAFGEHGTKEHSKTIYEELVRVPLLIRGAGIAPRRVDERVGLIDLGPTILDLFGQPTPAVYQGQSLVPLLVGEQASLDRPILAEGRLRRALYTKDGLKVIADARRKVVEVYDLAKDPGELRNLWDVERERSDRALAELEAFFAAHARRDPGYHPPYKP